VPRSLADCVVNIEPPLEGADVGATATEGGSSDASASSGVAPGSRLALTLGDAVTGTAIRGQHTVFTVRCPDSTAFIENDLLIEVKPQLQSTERDSDVGGVTLGGGAAGSSQPVSPPLGGEADIYVDTAPQKDPSLLKHRWKWNGAGGSGTVRVSEASPVSETAATGALPAAPTPRTFYVGVTTISAQPALYVLKASMVPRLSVETPAGVDHAGHADTATRGPDDVLCATCGAAVPRSRYDMHSAVCAVRLLDAC
jgi:hypothetical protein